MQRVSKVVVLWFVVSATFMLSTSVSSFVLLPSSSGKSSQQSITTKPKTHSSINDNGYFLQGSRKAALTETKLDVSREYDPDHNKSLLERATSHLVPSMWFKDQKTHLAEMDRRRHRKEVEKEVKQAFRGTPFPFRMAANALASKVGKSVRKEGRKLDKLLNQAQQLIAMDERVLFELGEPIVVGNEFSQSASTRIVNGKKTERVQASFEVLGSRRNGIGALVAENKKLVALKVTVGGRSILIDT